MGDRQVIGLSARGRTNVAAIMPKITAAVKARSEGTQIDLASAENWLIRPEIIALCKDAIATNLHAIDLSYPRGFAGFPEVMDAFVTFFNKYFKPKIPVEISHLATAPGAATCIDTLLYNICDPGDGILIPGPYWSGFDFQFQARSSAVPIPVVTPDLESTLSEEELIPALELAWTTAQIPIKGMLMSNPQNPIGQCYTVKCIEECIKFCQRRNIHYISDEVYALTSFPCAEIPDPIPFVSALSLDLEGLGCDLSRVHTVWSTSKDFGQSGIRMGCTITQGNREMAVGVTLASHTQTSTLAAICVASILTSPQLPGLLVANSERLAAGYSMVVAVLQKYKLRYLPSGAGLYVFAQIAPDCDSWDEEQRVVAKLKQEDVLVSAGRGYHGPESEKGWARIGFAIPMDKLEVALQVMDKVFREEAAQRENGSKFSLSAGTKSMNGLERGISSASKIC